jgi:hypothetical protein
MCLTDGLSVCPLACMYVNLCLFVRQSTYECICLSIHLLVCLSVDPLVCMLVCPSTYKYICLSIHLLVCQSVHPLMCTSVCPSILNYVCLFSRPPMYLFMCLFLHSCVYMYIRLSVHSYLCSYIHMFVCPSVFLLYTSLMSFTQQLSNRKFIKPACVFSICLSIYLFVCLTSNEYYFINQQRNILLRVIITLFMSQVLNNKV